VSTLATLMANAVASLSRVPRDIDAVRVLDDDALLTLTRIAADQVRLAQLNVSLLAGEIARRSAPELGSDGLAQREGHRTPEEVVRVTTGTTSADARAVVRVGAAAGAETPSALSSAVLSGRVSVAIADAIMTGLGRPTPTMDARALDAAASSLLERVATLDPDRARREARALRDELDLAGVAHREEERRNARSFRMGKKPNGMGWAHWTLDPETYAIVSDIFERVTSPKRRTPRFDEGSSTNTVDRAEGPGADLSTEVAEHDERTTEQYASDVFAELLRHGVDADTSGLLADGPAAVRVIVAAQTLNERRGRGWFEGQVDPISVDTVERLACASGSVTLTVDGGPDNAGQPLNLGRERRLYSRAQRLALAARDGGCRWPGCERPPSWCEAHHINHWHRDGGRTDVADGILLCRHHHRLAHNNGWEIERAGPGYLLHPPEKHHRDDTRRAPAATVRDMPSKSPALRVALSA